jgi:L-alanine-DL-glutamate epimerase-like enolase superfamily enzyme
MKGFRNFKLKVGGEKVEEDIARIKEIVRLYPDVKMRVDANQGFTAESALKFIEAMEQSKIHLEMIEQPVPKERIDQLDFIAQRSIVPIIADEACRTLQDAEMLLTQTAVQGVNVKVMKCGLYQSVEIARLAKQLDKKLMMGCMLESTVGIAAGAAIAAGVGGFDYIDLDGHFLILGNQRSDQFETVGPVLRMHTDVFPA